MDNTLKQLQTRILDNKKKNNFNTTDLKFEMLLLYGEVNELFKGYLKNNHQNMAEELADIAIFTLGIAEMLDIDLMEAIQDKIAINEKRVYHADGSKELID